jgi:hypothetical protein
LFARVIGGILPPPGSNRIGTERVTIPVPAGKR